MAKGALSPRQKMINLMYLIFIAMLAMNVDRSVLDSFSAINDTLMKSVETTSALNKGLYADLEKKSAQFSGILPQAEAIKASSNDFFTYLDEIKSEISTDLERNIDKSNLLDNILFQGDGLTEKGTEFVAKMEAHKANLLANAKTEASKIRLNDIFSTTALKNANKGWLKEKFYEQPLIASVTNLTKMQLDIRNEEANLINSLTSKKLEANIELKEFIPIVDGSKIYRKGEAGKASVSFGSYDNTLSGSATFNGRSASLTKGRAQFNVPTGRIGTFTAPVTITFENSKGEKVTKRTTYLYEVVDHTANVATITKPKDITSASISAEKMNVVYRGVSNPMSAAVAGVKPGTVRMSASSGSLSGSGTKYKYRPGGGSTVNFTVTGISLVSGKRVSVTKKFRIKNIPPPRASIRGSFEPRMSKSSLGAKPVEASIPGFEFPVKIRVTSFMVKVPGKPTILVKGNRMNAQAKRAISSARPRSTITIGNIKATLVGGGPKLGNIPPVVVSLKD